MFCGLFYTYNTMVMVFLQFESIWASLATRVRSRSCQKFQILKCLILKNIDLFLMQNDPRIPMVLFVFLYVV